ncbi:MAG: tyrosine-type recombinase/integrase [Streptosporangiaceae bacterium]
MGHAGPFGVPWLERPLGERALTVRAACLKGYYLDLTTCEGVNRDLREALLAHRRPGAAARDRSFLGHLPWPVPANPLLPAAAPPRRHPRMLPDGAAAAVLAAVRTARDKMIVTWLADSGLRIGELCGLWFCDLHLVQGHACGERAGPHVHVVRRVNPNGARAKTARPARLVAGIVTGGTVRRASPAMAAAYHEYLIEDYHRLRALAQHDLVLVQLAGDRAGEPLSAHGARQMLERAGRRAGVGLVTPHAFRHSWASALTTATGGNTKAVADEGGWASARTVEDTYAHLAGDPVLEAALQRVWQAVP